MTPNPQQQAVIDWALNGAGSANVIARAGCGKTSLLVKVAEALASQGRRRKVFMGAFNSSIAKELESRVPWTTALVKTMHGIGLKCFKSIVPATDVDGNKVRTLARQRHAFDKKSTRVVVEAVGYAKQSGFGIDNTPYDDAGAWSDLLDYHELTDEIPSDISNERIIESCIWAYKQSLDQCMGGKIDFNDMILAPLYFAKSPDQFRQFDWVMVDELQDQNHTRRILAERLLLKGGRFLGVGDPAQAIYAFAGADADSMEKTKAHMGCVEFPLNVTYRCPKLIVTMAQQWVPDFTAHEDNAEGVISVIGQCVEDGEMEEDDEAALTPSLQAFWRTRFNPDHDVILCRNRRPLVGIAKRFRKMGIQCVVEGGNGRGLISLAEKWGEERTIEELAQLLSDFRLKEVAKYMAKDDEERAEAVRDKVDILFDMMDGLDGEDTVTALVKRIERTFDDSGESPNLKLCTIHRAKGREWNRVFLIGRNRYMPSYFAVKSAKNGNPRPLAQEQNLMYVAVTRTKSELVEVNVPPAVNRNGQKAEKEWWEI
jgi:superfamily I DNA/RNA helicase